MPHPRSRLSPALEFAFFPLALPRAAETGVCELGIEHRRDLVRKRAGGARVARRIRGVAIDFRQLQFVEAVGAIAVGLAREPFAFGRPSGVMDRAGARHAGLILVVGG